MLLGYSFVSYLDYNEIAFIVDRILFRTHFLRSI